VFGEAVEPTLRYSAHSLQRTMQEIVSFNRSPLQQETPLVGLVGLLEREPHIEYRYCEVSQRYSWLLGDAAKLAERIILNADAKTPQFHDAVLCAIELEAQGPNRATTDSVG
jgi:hypothetical protein